MRKMNETEAARVLDHFRRRGVAGVHEHPCICRIRIRSIMIMVDPGHRRLLPGHGWDLGAGIVVETTLLAVHLDLGLGQRL